MARSSSAPFPESTSPIQVIARAATLLRALEATPEGMSLAQLAETCGLARSTVQRIAAALLAEDFLTPASGAGGLRLGPALPRLARAIATDPVNLLRGEIEALSAHLGETVDLARIEGSELVFLDQCTGSHRLQAVSAVGARFPLHACANGKAYLASLDDADVTALMGADFAAHTPATVTSITALLAELARVRSQGFAEDREEYSEGICAVGIYLAAADGTASSAQFPLLSVSVPMPAARFAHRRGEIATALLAAKPLLLRRLSRV